MDSERMKYHDGWVADSGDFVFRLWAPEGDEPWRACWDSADGESGNFGRGETAEEAMIETFATHPSEALTRRARAALTKGLPLGE